jgi:hypothetical protein
MIFNSALDGTRVNAVGVDELIVCAKVESLADHFANNGWSSFQDQIDAGYPFYLEPSLLSASYAESFDCGRHVVRARVTVTFDWVKIDGDVQIIAGIGTVPQLVTLQTSDDSDIVTSDDFTIILDSFDLADIGASTYGYRQTIEDFQILRLTLTFTGRNNKSLFKLSNLAVSIEEF